MWKGIIRLGDDSVPVKLYAAAVDRGVHFRLLHAADRQPVSQEMVHPETGEPVSSDEVRKGYEIEPGVFVVLEPEELESVAPPASRDIEIARFVEPGLIAPAFYDRPYYLGPDGDDDAYAALAAALAAEHRVGIARWTMRHSSYLGALTSDGQRLSLIRLRRASEVVQVGELDIPAPDINPRELELARQLIAALEGELDTEQLRDQYRDKVLELVEAKRAGETIDIAAPRRRRPTESLIESLEASLTRARERGERGVA
jgi:DNA end-binding protein Ku